MRIPSSFAQMTMEFTLAILGDGSAGKSSIVQSFVDDGFKSVYKQTIGIDFHEKIADLRSKMISMRVWDVGGQSIHSDSIKQYVSASSALFLVYDVTNDESFRNLDDWVAIVVKKNKVDSSKIYLVGNKVDMIDQRQVSVDRHEQFIEENHLGGGFFMSAKTGENVLRTFYTVANTRLSLGLSDAELEHYNKVVKAHVKQSGDDEGRTEWADRIEEEDRLAAMEAQKRQNSGCQCF